MKLFGSKTEVIFAYADGAVTTHERVRLANPDHGKKIVCRITAKGRALYQRVLPKARDAQARVLALLEPQERAVLHATLVKLRKALSRP